MKIILNSRRGCRAVAVICLLVGMVIIIAGLGIYCMCKLCKKLDKINQGNNDTNNPAPYTNSPVSLTVQRSANMCEWTNVGYMTGWLSMTEFHLTVLDAERRVVTNYTVPLGPHLELTNNVLEDHGAPAEAAQYRIIGTNADDPNNP